MPFPRCHARDTRRSQLNQFTIMRNNKLINKNRQFMWANILLGLFVVGLVFAFMYFCGIF